MKHMLLGHWGTTPGHGGPVVVSNTYLEDKLIKDKQYIGKYGEDLPEIRHWKWGAAE